jgi:hypothetical protein
MRCQVAHNSRSTAWNIGCLILLAGVTMLALVAEGCTTAENPQDSAGLEQTDSRDSVPAISHTVGDLVGDVVDKFTSPPASPSPDASLLHRGRLTLVPGR